MGKPTGFMEYQRKTGNTVAPLERIKNFKEFHLQLPKKEQQMQAARCMACGVPFCQAGTMIAGMASGCPNRSEEHTSELQSRSDLVCRLLLEKKKNGLGFLLQALFFFFNDTATTEIYTLSLHDALPICS